MTEHKRQRRPGLTEISYNLRRRSRNSFNCTVKQTTDTTRKLLMDESEPPKRRRGRPRRIPDTVAQNSLDQAVPVFDAQGRSQSSILRRTSSSPRKHAKHIDQPRAPTSIDMPYLGRCNPRVRMKSFQEAKSTYQMPQSVITLHTRLQDIPLGLIPSELKVGTRAQLSLFVSAAELIFRRLMRAMRKHLANQESPQDLSTTLKKIQIPTLHIAYNL